MVLPLLFLSLITDHSSLPFRSERKLQRELDLPEFPDRVGNPSAGSVAGSGPGYGDVVRKAKIRMIEQVEKLRPELQAGGLPEPETLYQRQVKVSYVHFTTCW